MVVSMQVALGLGTAGALVDVSSYITGTEGVTYSWGRQSEFRDPNPGVITFVLDNYDGRFTPGNTASPYATPLSEGAVVSWLAGTRIVTGVVTGIGFATSEQQWGRVTITCGDPLVFANRTQITDFARMIGATGAYLWWPFNDAATSAVAAGNPGPSIARVDPGTGLPPALMTFGVAASAPTGDTQLQLAQWQSPTAFAYASTNLAAIPTITYPAGSFGSWGLWVTPVGTAPIYLDLRVSTGASTLDLLINSGVVATLGAASAPVGGVPVPVTWQAGVPHHVAVTVGYSGSTVTLTVFVDGVQVASGSATVAGLTNVNMQPTNVQLIVGDNVNAAGYLVDVAHLYHAPALQNEAAAGVTTEAVRFTELVGIVPQITVGTVDAALSTAPLAPLTAASGTVFASICDLLRTEQGHLYATTSGTLLAPSTSLNLRARTRPATVTLTLDAQKDVSGIPQFDRDVTNMFGTVTASGPVRSSTITDAAAVARVGSASTSENVMLLNNPDLYGWASDRMVRGENVALKVTKVDVDTLTAVNVTAAQVMALLPGDRVRITNLPGGPLGFTQWDGWFLGADELHAFDQDRFTLYLAPVLTGVGIYDTDVFGAGGELSLSAALTNVATTMSVASADGVTKLATSGFPYTLLIDLEQVTVTACTGATPQVATITRAVNGTAAAAHSSGALVDAAVVPVFAF